MKRPLLMFAFLLGLAGAARAQGGLLENTLTNHDIVVLAQAGFTESFIADLIAVSRTRFDTSVNGLAEMAKEGLNERLIRVIVRAAASAPADKPAVPSAAPAAAILPAAVMAPPMEANRKKRGVEKESESAMAIANQAPYYRTSSIFWGFWKKKTGVGAGMRTVEQPMGVQLGTAYGQVQIVNPAGVPARYVVIP